DAGIDWSDLPRDGSAARVLLNPNFGHVVDYFDGVLPYPEEDEGRAALRRIGLRSAMVLSAWGDGDPLDLARCTLDGSDRWFYYWGGGAQEGNWGLFPECPATRGSRRRETVLW